MGNLNVNIETIDSISSQITNEINLIIVTTVVAINFFPVDMLEIDLKCMY